MRYLFLLNPAAGKQDCTVQLIPQIRAAAARAGWSQADYTIHTTEYAGHARELARAAAKEAAQAGDSLRIWTAGGDGTFMEAMTGVQGVANAAVALGMEVLGYDPYISIDAAWSLSRSVQHCVTLGDMLPRCDYLTIHVPYLPTTRHTINAQTLAMCKDGGRVLNLARGELVDNAALLDALNSGKVAQYFCDFPTEELLGVKGVYCTPHLGASTPESETNCAVMAAAELSDYLKNGNITHSVNLPDVSQPRVSGRRICIIHKNAPGAISAITGILTEAHLNIENMVNKGKKDVAYTLLDVTGNVTDDLAVKLGAIEPAIRVRVL